MNGYALLEPVFGPDGDLKDYRYLEVNEAFGKHTGWNSETCQGRLFSEIAGEPDYAWLPNYSEVLSTGNAHSYEGYFKTFDKFLKINIFRPGPNHLAIIIDDISAQTLSEKAIRESEANYKMLIENQTELIVKTDGDGLFLFISPSYCDLFGKSQDELLNQSFVPLVHEEDREATLRALDALKVFPHTCYIEQRAYTRFGWRWIAWSDKAIVNADGQITEIIGVGRDITQRKEAERRLIESNTFLNSLLYASPDAIFILNVQTLRWEFFSEKLIHLTGYQREEIILLDSSLDVLFDVTDKAEFITAVQWLENMPDREVKSFEIRLKQKSGQRIWILARIQLFDRDKQGKPLKVLGIFTNVTDRKIQEMALGESELRFRNIINEAPMGMHLYELTDDNRLIFIGGNPAADRILGISHTTLIGKTIGDCFPELEKTEIPEIYRKVALEGQNWRTELVNYSDNRISGVFEVNAFRVSQNRVAIFFLDVTERMVAQEELRESEERFRTLSSAAFEGIGITYEGKIVDLNQQLADILGYTREELIGKPIMGFVAPESQEEVKQHIQANKPGAYEHIALRKDGKRIVLEIVGSSLPVKGQQYRVSAIRDITERKQAERKLLDAIIQTEEKERLNFSRNLHDDLGPLLSSAKMYIGSITPDSEKNRLQYILTNLNEIVREAIQTTKEISNGLSPHLLVNYGLVSAVEAFIARQPQAILYHFISNFRELRFENTIEFTTYRIIKELVNNSLKHSQAANIWIDLEWNEVSLKISYRDDGIGLPDNILQKDLSAGMGLYNITNRLKSLNAKFKLGNAPVRGMEFEAWVPASTIF